MIIPPNTKLRLNPQDDYTHLPEPVSNYNESMYFNAFDSSAGVGAWMRIGNRPNEGHAEMTCCVYLPDGKVGFMYARQPISDNKAMDAGVLRFDMIEPFKRMRVRYEGDLLLMANPLDMANPSAAFKSNPKKPALIELDYEGVSPMHGGEIVTLDDQPIELDPEHAVFRGHLEQYMAATGHITVDGQRYAFSNGTGYRDKSWGPRYWHNFYWYRWVPVTFGPDFGVLLSIMGREGDEPYIMGNVLRDGTLTPVRNVKMTTDWDESFHHRGFTVTFDAGERSYQVDGKVRSLVPLRHKAQPGGDQTTYTRITEALTEYRCEGRTVLAMSEFCDLVTNGIPISHQLGYG
ncbi:MAG: hypothetical protein ABI574_09535 [Burkholderiales bacterium]